MKYKDSSLKIDSRLIKEAQYLKLNPRCGPGQALGKKHNIEQSFDEDNSLMANLDH